MNRTPHVPPTLEGRVMVELGATLARARREQERVVEQLEARIDTLEQQLAGAHEAVQFWRRIAVTLGYDDTLIAQPLFDQA